MNGWRGALLVALTVLAIAAVRDIARMKPEALPWNQLLDSSDFYCAGAALDSGVDPYLYEPLHRCEHAVNVGSGLAATFFASYPNLVVPAPQPPYDFLPFMGLARLPFAEARIVAATAIVVSIAFCAMALWALGVPFEVAIAALVLSTGWVELQTGQVAPYALLALVLCGLALARGRDALAGILAVLTAIEPTVGVPVVAATLAFVPRARATLVTSALLLVTISVVILGPRGVFEYVTAVLPAHAGTELYFPFQYSASYALATLGVPAAGARLAGALSYLVFLIAGLLLAPRASAAMERRELLVFIPALCALIAGPFLHEEELCFALPAVAILAISTRGTARVVCAVALCALAIPWIRVWTFEELILASIFIWAVILLRLRIDLRIVFTVLGIMAAAIYAFDLQRPIVISPLSSPHAYPPDSLAQSSWRDFAENFDTSNDALWLAVKVPTWTALLAAFAAAARCATNLKFKSARDT